MGIIQKEELEKIQGNMAEKENTWIKVGMATCGIAAGADKVYNYLKSEVEKRGLNVEVRTAGCIGNCYAEPLVEVKAGGKQLMYNLVDEEFAAKILDQHIAQGEAVAGSSYIESSDLNPGQMRIALRHCGIVDPESLDSYIYNDGYIALRKAVTESTPQGVIDEMKTSGLRGRGGAGFPTFLKWTFGAKSQGDEKYIICNADEGDPGAYMDRSILEGDPHAVIEGMMLGGYAIGANKGFFYVRAEYPLAIRRLQKAIDECKGYGIIGENIFGSDFSFDIEIRLGAGAFVCGEETALIASIEGKRGTPSPRPPFPTDSGVFGKPSVINNVETLSNVSAILLKGGEWYGGIGTEKSKGTKVFAVTGKIKNAGLVEIPMGTSLKTVVYDICGGIANGKKYLAVQTGGPSGGVITEEYLNTEISYESLGELGSIMGSGGMIVMDEDDCIVDIAKFYLGFCVDESCGKCSPCRIGGQRMLGILEKITDGHGEMEDIENLKKISNAMKKASLCGLGQTAPNPVLSTLRYFEREYIDHIEKKSCRAGVCQKLLQYKILLDKCKKCGKCQKNCPVDAIEGDRKSEFVIDQEKCIKCGLCVTSCPFDAVIKE